MVTQNSADETKSGNVFATPRTNEKDNTMAMFIMAGMVVSSAGFAMYTKQADSLLRRMNRASKIPGMAKSPMKAKTNTKLILKSDRNATAKKIHEKEDFF